MLRPFPPERLPRRRLAPLDAAAQRRHKLRNLAQSALLLGGMIGLMALCGWLLFGPGGVLGLGLGAALALALAPQVSPAMVLRLYRARELAPEHLPAVFAVLAQLTERAGLPRRPRLFYAHLCRHRARQPALTVVRVSCLPIASLPPAARGTGVSPRPSGSTTAKRW